jgi:hypothetical protein
MEGGELGDMEGIEIEEREREIFQFTHMLLVLQSFGGFFQHTKLTSTMLNNSSCFLDSGFFSHCQTGSISTFSRLTE